MGIFDFLFGKKKGTSKHDEADMYTAKDVTNLSKDAHSRNWGIDDENPWMHIVNVRTKLMPLNSDGTELTTGSDIDDLGKMHYEEYKTNESNVPQNKRKEVAINRIEGLSSIREYIQSEGSDEQKFHLDASIIGALLYASSIGKHLNEDLLKYKEMSEKLESDVVSNLYKQIIGKEEENEKWKKQIEEKKSKESIENENGFNKIFEDDGSYIEMYKKDGIPNGEYKKFNSDGVLIVHYEYLLPLDSNDIYYENLIELDGNNFIVDGTYKTWHNDGSIKCEANFIKGELNGRKIEIGEDGMIDRIGYFKDDESIDWNSEENMKKKLREIKKYMTNGVEVYSVEYMGLCESLGYDGGWSNVDSLEIITNVLSNKKNK